MNHDRAKVAIKQSLTQEDIGKVFFFASEWFKYSVVPMGSLLQLEILSHRKTVTLSRCQTLAFAVLVGKHKNCPMDQKALLLGYRITCHPPLSTLKKFEGKA